CESRAGIFHQDCRDLSPTPHKVSDRPEKEHEMKGTPIAVFVEIRRARTCPDATIGRPFIRDIQVQPRMNVYEPLPHQLVDGLTGRTDVRCAVPEHVRCDGPYGHLF